MMRLLTLILFASLVSCRPSADNPSSAPQDAPAMHDTYQDLTVTEFAERIGGDNTVLLDVRTPAETARGIIDGAIEMDFRSPDFADQLKTLDPEQTYLVYCASGGRSGRAAQMLHELGARKVYNLKGGYAAWTKQ